MKEKKKSGKLLTNPNRKLDLPKQTGKKKTIHCLDCGKKFDEDDIAFMKEKNLPEDEATCKKCYSLLLDNYYETQ